jgi:hypothetical protein
MTSRETSHRPMRQTDTAVVRGERRIDQGGAAVAGRITVAALARGSGTEQELTSEEAAAAFDRIARTALDLSGQEFLAALDEGSSTNSSAIPTLGCSTCSWRCPSYADAPCRELRPTRRSKPSSPLSNERWPASYGQVGRVTWRSRGQGRAAPVESQRRRRSGAAGRRPIPHGRAAPNCGGTPGRSGPLFWPRPVAWDDAGPQPRSRWSALLDERP